MSDSAAPMKASVEPESSHAHDASESGSEATVLRGPMRAVAMSPLASAKRYEGIGTGWWNLYTCGADALGAAGLDASGRPLAMTGSGEVMVKSNVDLTSGVSWQGKMERAWMAWHCENM